MRHLNSMGSLVCILAMSGALSLLQCSSDGVTPTVIDSAVAGSYSGTLAGDSDLAGTLSLQVKERSTTTSSLKPLAVSGYDVSGSVTLNVPGLGPVAVSGAIDLATGSVTFSGTTASGAITFSGRYENGILSGEVTTPWGPAAFSLTNAQLGGLRVFCGTFSGDLRGRWNVFTAAGRAGGVFAAASGERGILGGTSTSTAVALQIPPSGTASGAISGDAISGEWSTGAGKAGTFAVSESSCASLPPRVGDSVDGGTDAGTDSGTDGSTPDTGATDAGTPSVQKLHSITANSFGAIISNGSFTHFVVDSIPNELWVVNADASVKTKIHNENVYAIASSSKNVFFSYAGLSSLSVLGGGAPTTLVQSIAQATSLYADDTDVYANTSGGTINKYSSAGVAGGSYASQPNVRALTGDATDLYWDTLGSFVNYTGRGVWRAPKTMQGTPTEVIPAADFGSGTTRMISVIVEGNDLFALGFDNTPTYRLFARPKNGSGSTVVVATKGDICQPVADASYLYYGEYDVQRPSGSKGQIWRVPRSNLTAQPVSVYKSDEAVQRLAADATNLYFTTATSVYRLTKP